jgi:hypothetical protein
MLHNLSATSTLFGIASVFVLALVGCTGDINAEDTNAGADEALTADRAHDFKCEAAPSEDLPAMHISLSGRTLTWKNGSGTGHGDAKGTLDPTYKPSAANANFVRFVGFDADEGTTTFLAEKQMLKGQTGFVRYQNQGEGFSSVRMTCHAE